MHAQKYERAEDSIAVAKVMEIPFVNLLIKDDEYKREHVRYLYHNHTYIRTKRKPSAEFKYYWIQVSDSGHRRANTAYNFYVNPKDWEVKYFDSKSNALLALDEWTERNKMKKPDK